MSKTEDVDYEKLHRWLLGQAERCVTANDSKATFVSDLLFESAEAISSLLKERDELKEALVDMLDEYDGVYDSSGTVEGRAPYQSERAKEACEKARAALASAPGPIEEPRSGDTGEPLGDGQPDTKTREE